jgi:hypothetical protein
LLYAKSEENKTKLQLELETKKADIEIIELELDALKDEKEDLLSQLHLMSQIPLENPLDLLSKDEL